MSHRETAVDPERRIEGSCRFNPGERIQVGEPFVGGQVVIAQASPVVPGRGVGAGVGEVEVFAVQGVDDLVADQVPQVGVL